MLKVAMCNPDGGAFKYITAGILNALKAAKIPCLRWTGHIKDLRQFAPTLYIGATGWWQDIPSDMRHNMKVAMHVNPFCNETLRTNGPVINEPAPSIQRTLGQNPPDAVFGYGCQEDMDKYWAKWKKWAKVVPMPTAADTTIYYPEPVKKLECDVAFVGGRWDYKAKTIDTFLVPVLRKFKSRVHGWGGWKGHPYYQGPIDDNMVRKVLSSAKVGPSIGESHTIQYGIDIPERVFKVPMCGTPTFCETIAGMERFFPKDVLPMAKTPPEYVKICQDLLNDKQMRDELMKKQRDHIKANHTYFHRVAGLLETLGFTEEAANVLKQNKL